MSYRMHTEPAVDPSFKAKMQSNLLLCCVLFTGAVTVLMSTEAIVCSMRERIRNLNEEMTNIQASSLCTCKENSSSTSDVQQQNTCECYDVPPAGTNNISCFEPHITTLFPKFRTLVNNFTDCLNKAYVVKPCGQPEKGNSLDFLKRLSESFMQLHANVNITTKKQRRQ